MCVGVKNRIVTCEKCMFWCEKGYEWILVLGSPKKYYYGAEFADITCFNEDSSFYHVSFVKKHHFRPKPMQEAARYLQKCGEDCISLKKPIPTFQIKLFDDENECKIERMNCLEK